MKVKADSFKQLVQQSELFDPNIDEYIWVVVIAIVFIVSIVTIDLFCCVKSKGWTCEPYYLRMTDKQKEDQIKRATIDKKSKYFKIEKEVKMI